MTPPNCSSEKYSAASASKKRAFFRFSCLFQHPCRNVDARDGKPLPAQIRVNGETRAAAYVQHVTAFFKQGGKLHDATIDRAFISRFSPTVANRVVSSSVFFKIGNHTENILIRQNNLSNFNLSIKLSNDKNLFKNSSLNYLYTKYKFWRSKIFVCCQTIISYRYPI